MTRANLQVGKADPVPAGQTEKSQERGQGPPSRPTNLLSLIPADQTEKSLRAGTGSAFPTCKFALTDLFKREDCTRHVSA